MLSKISSKYFGIFLLIWLSGTASGFFLLGAYHVRPGQPGKPLVRWPEGCPVRLDPDRPTLLIFLHPRCPCSRASVAELASIAASYRGRFAAHAILYRPEGPSEDWDQAEAAATDEASIPGLRRWTDRSGRWATDSGSRRLGRVLADPRPWMERLLREAASPLRAAIGGGISASKPWSNASSERDVEPRVKLIFGCPILDPASTSRAELTR